MWWYTQSNLPLASPIVINFMPSWWNYEYGLCFGSRIFYDWAYRAQLSRDMGRLMHERLGDAGLGEADPKLSYFCDDLNNATLPAALGCEVVYAENAYPESLPLPYEDACKLRMPEDLCSQFPMREIIRQAHEMSAKAGAAILPSWTCMGVQNIALKVRGCDLFTDYYAEPELAKHLLEISAQCMEKSVEYFDATGMKESLLSNQNCAVPLCGEGIYRDFLLAYDQQLLRFAQKMGWKYHIHHCGNFDQYAEVYKEVGPVPAFDIGMESQLRLALDTWPQASINAFVSCFLVREASANTIRDYMRSQVDAAGGDLHRVTFVLSDLDYGTPDENIRAVIEGLL